jgi:hypothetical protein
VCLKPLLQAGSFYLRSRSNVKKGVESVGMRGLTSAFGKRSQQDL